MSGQYAVHAMRIAFAVGRHADARTYAEQSAWRALRRLRCTAQSERGTRADRAGRGGTSGAPRHICWRRAGVDGSPVLGSFGPNTALAKELLEHGERETVLEYFELCSRFWDPEKLGVWADLVRAGRIPDFGGNLLY